MKALIASICVTVLTAIGWGSDHHFLRTQLNESQKSWDQMEAVLEQSSCGVFVPTWADVEADPRYKKLSFSQRSFAMRKWTSDALKADASRINQLTSTEVEENQRIKQLLMALDSVENPEPIVPVSSLITPSTQPAPNPDLTAIKDQMILAQDAMKRLADQNAALSEKLDAQAVQLRNASFKTSEKTTSMFHDYTIMTPGHISAPITVIDDNP